MTVNADYSAAPDLSGVRYWSPSLRAMAGTGTGQKQLYK